MRKETQGSFSYTPLAPTPPRPLDGIAYPIPYIKVERWPASGDRVPVYFAVTIRRCTRGPIFLRNVRSNASHENHTCCQSSVWFSPEIVEGGRETSGDLHMLVNNITQ